MFIPRAILDVLVLTMAITVSSTKQAGARASDENSEEEASETFLGKNQKSAFSPTSTKRPTKGEVVVERFVETLMSSERYLKMIEVLDKKLDHLDASFHERSNTVVKYLTEIMRQFKTRLSPDIEETLKTVSNDLGVMRKAVIKIESLPTMRVDGRDPHLESALETRLTFLEGNTKAILAGVESIVTTIAEVKNRQHTRNNAKMDGGSSTSEALGLISDFRRTLQEQKTRKCECKVGRVDRSERYPTDCHEIQMQGFNVSGIYKIKPDEMEPFYVLCDLTTAGGGWTVFQNRFDGSQDFYKTWSEYKYGFGNLAGEFWLGLEKLHYLTNQKLYEVRIEMETQHGQDAYAGYSVFTVGPEYEGYRISTLGTFYGTAGDSMSYHAGQKFSSHDVDNDDWKDGSCAVEHGGAWWYKECDKSNLNGIYSLTPEEHRGQTIYWISFKGPKFPLTKTKMMIRPLPASRPTDFGDQTRTILETSDVRAMPDKQLTGSRVRDSKPKARPETYRYNEQTPVDSFFGNYA